MRMTETSPGSYYALWARALDIWADHRERAIRELSYRADQVKCSGEAARLRNIAYQLQHRANRERMQAEMLRRSFAKAVC